MSGVTIQYKKGYKYQLDRNFSVFIPIKPVVLLKSGHWLRLHANGLLKIRHGYAWDGPSGPTIDTKTFMRGSLVHDALYQLMRERYLDYRTDRKVADKLLREICIQDGMSRVRANYVYDGVRLGGRKSAKPSKKHKDKITCVP